MNRLYIQISLLLTLLCSTACTDERQPIICEAASSVPTFLLTVSPMQSSDPQTKVVFDDNQDEAVHNLCWFTFDANDNCVAKGYVSKYYPPLAIHVLPPSDIGTKYKMLVVANIGNITAQVTTTDEAERVGGMATTRTAFETNTIMTWDSKYLQFGSKPADLPKGLPMSAEQEFTLAAGKQKIAVMTHIPMQLKRRVARFYLKTNLDMTNDNYQTFRLDSIKVTNIPKYIRLFDNAAQSFPPHAAEMYQEAVVYNRTSDNIISKGEKDIHETVFNFYMPENTQPKRITTLTLEGSLDNKPYSRTKSLVKEVTGNGAHPGYVTANTGYTFNYNLKARYGEAPANCYMVNPADYSGSGKYAKTGLVLPLSQAIDGLNAVWAIDAKQSVTVNCDVVYPSPIYRKVSNIPFNCSAKDLAHFIQSGSAEVKGFQEQSGMAIPYNYEFRFVTLWTDANKNYTDQYVTSDIDISAPKPFVTLSGLGSLQLGSNTVIGLVLREKGKTDNFYQSGDIVCWSWHLWVTDYAPNTPTGVPGHVPGGVIQKYKTPFFTNLHPHTHFMDRNLGATITGIASDWLDNPDGLPKDNHKYLGLLYQWGRKDPLPSRHPDKLSKFAPTAGPWGKNETWVSDEKTIVTADQRSGIQLFETVRKPMLFYRLGANPNNAEYWTSGIKGKDLWNSNSPLKSVFDPCPPGWRVPKGGSSATNNPWKGIEVHDFTWFPDPQNSISSMRFVSQGALYTTIIGNRVVNAWYPATGNLLIDYTATWWRSDAFCHQAAYGHTLKFSQYSGNKSGGRDVYVVKKDIKTTGDGRWAVDAIPVRCIQE